MRIVVCMKQVPDTMEVKINPSTNNLIRDGVPSIINPSDYTAIVKGIELADGNENTVTVISMGPPQVLKDLKRSLAMGADRAILLNDRRLGGSDTIATSYALAKTIEKIGYDLVLCGDEAIDGCTGQVGPMIGEYLGIPTFTNVEAIEVDHDKIVVKRNTEKTEEIYRASFPLVACVKKTIKKVEENAVDFEPEVWNADFLESTRIGTQGSPTRVYAISVGQRAKRYLEVEYDWDLEKRMEYIFSGGLEEKNTIKKRGSTDKMAEELLHYITSAIQ